MYTTQEAKDIRSKLLTNRTLRDTDENTMITANSIRIFRHYAVENSMTYRLQNHTEHHRLYPNFRYVTQMLTNSWARHTLTVL